MVAPSTAIGWELVDYEWDFETGLGQLTYERERADTGEVETRVTFKQQPAGPQHAGWTQR